MNDLTAAKTTVFVFAVALQQECASGIRSWPQSAGMMRQHSSSAAVSCVSGNRHAATMAGARLNASARTASFRSQCICKILQRSRIAKDVTCVTGEGHFAGEG
ncbi:MAG TPA: hypothetical protein VLE48_07800, partial [Terriglobales bacterium]|nr:hypothetical protein [Terriglobales bacterium]